MFVQVSEIANERTAQGQHFSSMIFVSVKKLILIIDAAFLFYQINEEFIRIILLCFRFIVYRVLTCGAYEEFVAYTSDMKRLNLICFVMKVIKTIDINIDNHD